MIYQVPAAIPQLLLSVSFNAFLMSLFLLTCFERHDDKTLYNTFASGQAVMHPGPFSSMLYQISSSHNCQMPADLGIGGAAAPPQFRKRTFHLLQQARWLFLIWFLLREL
jgi:hypothetical protein